MFRRINIIKKYCEYNYFEKLKRKMLILDEPIIQEFKEYSFWIKANLRDYEYNKEVIEDIKKYRVI
ncbi:MAG: hypothetical protein K2N51_12270, partial [Lachnospiraceae bacterium]|nr:hypothetical protein [Lachnospiraceae bacterium]